MANKQDIHQTFYHTNQTYTTFLANQNKKDFEKFADLIVKYSQSERKEGPEIQKKNTLKLAVVPVLP